MTTRVPREAVRMIVAMIARATYIEEKIRVKRTERQPAWLARWTQRKQQGL